MSIQIIPLARVYLSQRDDWPQAPDVPKTNGIRNPIKVRRATMWRDGAEDNNCYQVIVGNDRVNAYRKAGKTDAPALICDSLLPDEDAFIMDVAENISRTDISILEKEEFRAQLNKIKIQSESGKWTHPFSPEITIKVSRSALQRATKIASMLPNVKAAIKDAGLQDNLQAIEAIAYENSDDQLRAVAAQAKAIKGQDPKVPVHKQTPPSKKRVKLMSEEMSIYLPELESICVRCIARFGIDGYKKIHQEMWKKVSGGGRSIFENPPDIRKQRKKR